MSTVPMRASDADFNLRVYLEKLFIEKKNQRHDPTDTFERLYNDIRNKNWKSVKEIINSNGGLLTARLTESEETVLHMVAESLDAVHLVKMIVTKSPESLCMTDVFGNTALARASMTGNTKAVKIMLNAEPNLLYIWNNDGHGPLDHAARFGHKEAVCYLLDMTLSKTNDTPYSTGARGARLLMYLISFNLYGAAVKLLWHYKDILQDTSTYRKMAFEKLARKTRAFPSAQMGAPLPRLIYHCIPVVDEINNIILDMKEDISHSQNAHGDIENLNTRSKRPITKSSLVRFLRHILVSAPYIKGTHKKKLMHIQVLALSKIMCKRVDWKDRDTHDILKELTVVPARLGNYELVMEIINVYPPSIMTLDDEGHNMFQRAVIFRNEKVLNLLRQHVLVKEWVECSKDQCHGNKNILHLAAELTPCRQFASAALQMQEDLQWFKAVEKLVHPLLQEEESNGKTPREYFTEQHKELVKEGEEWMKKTASSCSVVAALIVAVVFAAMFVPGRSNDAGLPNLLKKSDFLLFTVLNMLAVASSTSSVVMFLGILTSRYKEDDFLVCLPMKLIIGLVLLFVSIATMIAAFGTAVSILLAHRIEWIANLMSLLIFFPVFLFELLHFPLLTYMMNNTYHRKLLKPKK